MLKTATTLVAKTSQTAEESSSECFIATSDVAPDKWPCGVRKSVRPHSGTGKYRGQINKHTRGRSRNQMNILFEKKIKGTSCRRPSIVAFRPEKKMSVKENV
jgi:hypothetical protein